MQHVLVASGVNRKSQIQYGGALALVPRWDDVPLPLARYRVCVIGENFRGLSEYMSFVSHLREVQYEWY